MASTIGQCVSLVSSLIESRLPIVAEVLLASSFAANAHVGSSWRYTRPLKRDQSICERRLHAMPSGSVCSSL